MKPYLLLRLWWNGLHWSTQTLVVGSYYSICILVVIAS